MVIERRQISGAILAGGRGRRMDAADKGLLPLLGRPLICHVIERLRPQVNSIIISANRHYDRYAQLGCPVFSDHDGGSSGPLAGLARILEEATTTYVMVVPCDMPFLPLHLADTLAVGLTADGGVAAVAHGAGRLQPLCLLLKRDVGPGLKRYRRSGGRKVSDWLEGLQPCVVAFPGCPEAFCNINTPEKLRSAALI